jgi:hypothetical protein
VIILAEEADADADSLCVDWNSVELHECTDLVIAPMADTKISRKIGIPVDDRSKEKDMDKDAADNGKRHFYEDVDGELMADTSQTYLLFLMLHACFYTICLVFRYLCIFQN